MRLIIAALANGTILKDPLKAHLQHDPRIERLDDLSDEALSYPTVSFAAAQKIATGEADRAILICGTGIGTAIAANKVRGIRAATAHDLVGVRGAVENYDAQVLCMGQNVIAAPEAWALVDIWLDTRHDTAGSYAPKVAEIAAFEHGE
jgi:sugar-phosphate isomerase, RpiB/LacA/LacB family